MTTAAPVAQRVAFSLHDRQVTAMDAIWQDGVDQLLYGGAAGGGKSEFLRAVAFSVAQAWPGARIAIFRDNFTQLQKTQVAAWHKKMASLGFDLKQHWSASNAEWHFPNPPDPRTGAGVPDTIVEFLHIDQTIGADKWLSSEWACLLIDESSQLKEHDLRTLYSRVRANEEQREYWAYLADEREKTARAQGLDDEAVIKSLRADWRPLAVYATNPGGVSHSYFLEEFVVPGRDEHFGEAWTVSEDVEVNGEVLEVRLRRKFIPAFLADNPSLDRRTYVAGLAQLAASRREQLLHGDWDYFEGKVFGMLDPDVHLIDARWPFGGKTVPPREWPRLGGLDHGTQSPTAALWNTRDEDGFFITYMEYYSPGAVGTHIRAIRELMSVDGALDIVFEADPRMWHGTRGRGDRQWSVAAEYEFGGEPPQSRGEIEQARRGGIRLHQFKGERMPGRMALERLLEPRPDVMFPTWHPKAGQFGAPLLFIAKQCPNLWREANAIQFEGEGSEETMKIHDHAYDAWYRSAPELERQVTFMSSRRRGAVRVEARAS